VIGPLLGRNVRQHAGLLVALGCGVAVLETLLVWLAAQLEAGPGLELLIELLPAKLRELIQSQFGLTTFSGLVAFGFQHPVVLVAGAAFVIVAGSIPAGERESGFLELILARPVRRDTYLAAVGLLLVLGALVLPLALLAGLGVGLATVESAGELPWTRYLPAAAGLAALLLAIGGVTLLLAAGARRRGQATAQAAGLALVLLWIETMGGLWAPLGALGWLSPFHYFKPIPAVVAGRGVTGDLLVLLGIFVATAAAALARFRKAEA
jgi:ABC-2 type transport system permease protein